MDLDARACDRVRLARDPRFDGRFYIAVRSTGIYCRPICPSPTARRANVRFYRSGEDAAAAGFRPCRRCRPDAAPGSPAWLGTSATVARALRLLVEGALREESLAALSRRLGVGARHLHRLFGIHLGTSPAAVARTWRLNHARRLLRETDLPMSRVALASGFRTVRRFNDAIRRLYGRTPTEIRRLRGEPRGADAYVFRLAYRPPYDWDALLEFLGRRALPGVEQVCGGAYRRTFSQDGRHGVLEVRRRETARALELRVRFAEPLSLLPIVRRVRGMFDVAADGAEIARQLRGEPLLGALAARRPGLRIPGAFDPFELAVRAALASGRSVPEETALSASLARRAGQPLGFSDEGGLDRVFPTPQALAARRLDGLPSGGGSAVRSVARSVLAGLSPADALPAQAAAIVNLRALQDPDAFPAGDPALRRAAGGDAPLTAAALAAAAERWRPWRGYAAVHLWSAAREETRRPGFPSAPVRRRTDTRPPLRRAAAPAGA